MIESWRKDSLINNKLMGVLDLNIYKDCETVMDFLKTMVQEGWFDSNMEVRRLLDSGAVKTKGGVLKYNGTIRVIDNSYIKVGKLHFIISLNRD